MSTLDDVTFKLKHAQRYFPADFDVTAVTVTRDELEAAIKACDLARAERTNPADSSDLGKRTLDLLVDLYKYGYRTATDHDRVRAILVEATGKDPADEG